MTSAPSLTRNKEWGNSVTGWSRASGVRRSASSEQPTSNRISRLAILSLCLLAIVLLAASPRALAQAAPLPSGLTNWWRAEGNALDTQSGLNGTVTNSAGFGAGEVGSGFLISSSNHGYVDFGPNVGISGTSDFTVDFWMRTTSTASQAIMDKRVGCGFGGFFSIRMNMVGSGNSPGYLFVELEDVSNSNHWVYFPTTLNDGVFHHVAVVRQGQIENVYIDGALAASANLGAVYDISNTADFEIGQSACSGSGDGTGWFDGSIDELHIFNRALAQSEVQSIFNAGASGLTTLVGYWKFDEGAGLTTADSSGNGNTGTLSGATLPAWVTSKPPVTFVDPFSLAFDGNTSYVTTGGGSTSALNFNTQVTVAAWVNPSQIPPFTYGIATKNRNPTGTGWGLRMEQGDPNFAVNNPSVNCTVRAINNPFVPNVWTHVAATYDSSTSLVQIYVNGVNVPVDNPSNCFGTLVVSSEPLNIGQEFPGRNFPGNIDEVRVYNRVLTAAEIAQLAANVSTLSVTATASSNTATLNGVQPTISANVTGGVPPYAYAWSNGATTASFQAPTSVAGITQYVVTVTDANGNQAQASTSITVQPGAVLTVTANNASRLFGAANPAFTYTITGFVNGDTVAIVNGAPVLSTTAMSVSPVGSYPITIAQGTLSAPGYTLTFVSGTLTVLPATANGTPGTAEYLYAANFFTNQIDEYTINANGTLAPLVATVSGVGINYSSGITVDPYSRYAYVSNDFSNAFTSFWVANNGLLNVGTHVTAGPVINPVSSVVDPQGRYLYVQGPTQLEAFQINAAALGTPTASSGPYPIGPDSRYNMAITPNGKFLFVPNTNAASGCTGAGSVSTSGTGGSWAP